MPPGTLRETGDPQPTLAGQAPLPVDGFAAEGFAHVEALRARVAEIESRYGGQAGLSFAAPHSDGLETLGTLTTGPAWSTSKIPIAVAYTRSNGVDSNVIAAITASDNQAATAMWAGLGDPVTAGNSANQILREGGDVVTVLETNYPRPGFSSFGQTVWNLKDQAVFGGNLQCISGSQEVVTLMGQVVFDQAYGLGKIPGAHFKGGWGPDPAGTYLARQFGFIPGSAPGTFVGVAIAAKPGDGTYASAQVMLNELADSFLAFPVVGGTC